MTGSMKKHRDSKPEKKISQRVDLSKLPLDRFANASRAENIYEVVKAGILMGNWAPGERIDDKELAEKLGVSRLSVREALSKLVEIRILEKKHWKGFLVRTLSREEIESIIEIRESLESLAIRKVIKTLTPRTESELEKALTAAETDLKNHDVESFFRSDMLFHEILYRASKNLWLGDILSNLRILIDLIRTMIQSQNFEQAAEEILDEHNQIFNALHIRDEAAAVRAMNRHFIMQRKRIQASLPAEK